MSKHIVAALQLGSDLAGEKSATLNKIMSYEQAIIDSKAELVVMPEALLGSYRKEKFSEHIWAIAFQKVAQTLPRITKTRLMYQDPNVKSLPPFQNARALLW